MCYGNVLTVLLYTGYKFYVAIVLASKTVYILDTPLHIQLLVAIKQSQTIIDLVTCHLFIHPLSRPLFLGSGCSLWTTPTGYEPLPHLFVRLFWSHVRVGVSLGQLHDFICLTLGSHYLSFIV